MDIANVLLNDDETAKFMQDKDGYVSELVKNNVSLFPVENRHIVLNYIGTPIDMYHKKALGMYTIRGEKPQRVSGAKIWGVSTHGNAGQSFVIDDIINPASKVQLLAVTGHAGTGKTFISMLGALNRPDTQQIIFTREVQECGKSLGFLRGDMDAKFNPYMRPLWDNLEELEYYSHKRLAERFQTVPMQFLRGSTVRNTVIIVDEAQNCMVEQLKMVISRCGSGSMVILLGSFNQIDTRGNTKENNGLAKVIKAFAGQELFSHIHLINDERSELARLADELL
jgi:PhoH-like ATPase